MNDEQPKTCPVTMHAGRVCGRPLYDGRRCICHSRKRDKDIGKFRGALRVACSDIRGGLVDLSGFVFPSEPWDMPMPIDSYAILDNAIFRGVANFHQAVFNKGASFRNARFRNTAQFQQARFDGRTTFQQARFRGLADFANATFNGGVVFTMAMFVGLAHFASATFGHGVHGGSVITFREGLLMHGAHFLPDSSMSISDSVICGDSSFERLSVEGRLAFLAVEFRGEVMFAFCSFAETARVSFDNERKPEDRVEMFQNEAAFIGNTGGRALSFRKVGLSRCLFLETDLSEARFVDVTWPRQRTLFGYLLLRIPLLRRFVLNYEIFDRKACYDELITDKLWLREQGHDIAEASPASKYNLIAQLYRQLQANWLNNFRYQEAGDFYVGEQVMVRKAKRHWLARIPSYLYGLIAYYGENFVLPFIWLILLMLHFPICLLLSGVHLYPDGPVVKYVWSWSPLDSLLFRGDFWKTVCANLSMASFNSGAAGQLLISPYQHGLVALERVLVISLATFFVLALHRAFKRKSF